MNRRRKMRMLYLYRGWNSGTNQAVLNAWRKGSPGIEIKAYDVAARIFPDRRSKLRALPHALRRADLGAICRGREWFGDAIKRSAWYMERISKEIDKLQRSEDFDFSLGVGPLILNLNPTQPHFVYNDGTMQTAAYFPEDAKGLDWRECIPYQEISMRKASMVFTMSEHVSRSLKEHCGLPRERVVRVNAGCNSLTTCEPEADRYERKNILFLGVEWERKGGPQLVEAFGKVRRRHPRATLTIVGCSPNAAGPGIRVVGRVPQEDVTQYLAEASFFCMVSRREPFGIAYIEAMRAGLPVISSDLGAAPDFVINGVTGYRVRHDSIEELADRLDELLTDPERCRRIGEQAQLLAESEYTWERTQQKMWNAIRSYLE